MYAVLLILVMNLPNSHPVSIQRWEFHNNPIERNYAMSSCKHVAASLNGTLDDTDTRKLVNVKFECQLNMPD